MEEARFVLKALNISCRKATENQSRKMDGALGLLGRLALRAHFLHCDPCTEAAAQMELLRKAMRSVAEGEASSGDRLASGDSGSEPPANRV